MSGNYQFGFTPSCRIPDDGSTVDACGSFLDSLDDSGLVILDVNSVFIDDCAVDLFSVTFDANLEFYTDRAFSEPVDETSEPFVIGNDYIYGNVLVNIQDAPSGEFYEFIDVSIEAVYVCTGSDPDDLASSLHSANAFGVGGCLSSSIDADGPYHVLGNGAVEELQGTILDALQSNEARFSFIAFGL